MSPLNKSSATHVDVSERIPSEGLARDYRPAIFYWSEHLNSDHFFMPEITRSITMDWRDSAACLTVDPELFFPVGNTGPAVDQIDKAKALKAARE